MGYDWIYNEQYENILECHGTYLLEYRSLYYPMYQCIWDYINSLREFRSWPPSTMELQRVLNTAHKQLVFWFNRVWDDWNYGMDESNQNDCTDPSFGSFVDFTTGWWFQTCFIFHNIGYNPSHWLSYFSRWLKPPTRLVLHVFPNAAFSQEPTNTLERTLKFSETLCWCVGCSPPKDCSTVHMLRFITLCQENHQNVPKTAGSNTVMAMAISYNWFFLWDYTFCKWGFLSTYNWYNLGHNCRKRWLCFSRQT